MKKGLYVTILGGIVAALLLFGCDFLLGPDEAAGGGTLSIGFGESGSRAAAPSDLERYDLVLTGPGEPVKRSVSAGESFNEQVALGEWHIEAKAYKAGNVLIGTGSADVTVKAGKNEARMPMTAVPPEEIIYTVSGTITTNNPGGAASGAGVQLKQGGANTGAAVSTGANGAYTITDVPAGEGYTIEVSLSGYITGGIPSFDVTGDVTGKDLMLVKIRPAGDQTTYTGDGITFKMAYVPGGHTVPTETTDSGTATVTAAYEIGETEVTYELWYTVRSWAEGNGYSFPGNLGREGSSAGSENTAPGTNKLEPVTMVTWFDAVVWLNALTEWVNAKTGSSLTPVYYYENTYTNVAKDSTPTLSFVKENVSHSYASAWAKPGATGFRLPSSNEWELAARWRNDSTNTVSIYTSPYFTKGDSASGATASYSNTTATGAVAWHNANSNEVTGTKKTQAVKGKTANALGLYDMSGNVYEWCDDWHPSYIGSYRIMRGGSWDHNALGLQVGYVDYDFPVNRDSRFGFRPARTAN
jgi:formylglycine-generating enzyme required for sulfatase activity